jgi:hypothetical protein
MKRHHLLPGLTVLIAVITAVALTTAHHTSTRRSPSIELLVNGASSSIDVPLGVPLTFRWNLQDAEGCAKTGYWADWTVNLQASDSFATQENDSVPWPYGISCTLPGGAITSSSVVVVPVIPHVRVALNPDVPNPIMLTSTTSTVLLGSFLLTTEDTGIYVSSFEVQESADIQSGVLPVTMEDLSVDTYSGAESSTFAVEPATQYVPSGRYTLDGIAWIPAGSVATVDVYGNPGKEPQPGLYSSPITLTAVTGGRGSDAQQDTFSIDLDLAGASVSDNEGAFAGQDLRAVKY